MLLPDVQENIDPVEDDVWDLGREADVLQEVGGPGIVAAFRRVVAQLVVDKVLGKKIE